MAILPRIADYQGFQPGPFSSEPIPSCLIFIYDLDKGTNDKVIKFALNT